MEEHLPERHPELAQIQNLIELDLGGYAERLALSAALSPDLEDRKGQRGFDLVHLHHITFTILVENALTGANQDTYSRYGDHFTKTLVLSRRISGSSLEETSGSRPTLLLDMGIIPSLFFTCWKCPSLQLQLQALELLEAWRHREGLWDSQLLVIFAKQLIQVELESSSSLESARRLDISLVISDDQTHATIKY